MQRCCVLFSLLQSPGMAVRLVMFVMLSMTVMAVEIFIEIGFGDAPWWRSHHLTPTKLALILFRSCSVCSTHLWAVLRVCVTTNCSYCRRFQNTKYLRILSTGHCLSFCLFLLVTLDTFRSYTGCCYTGCSTSSDCFPTFLVPPAVAVPWKKKTT